MDESYMLAGILSLVYRRYEMEDENRHMIGINSRRGYHQLTANSAENSTPTAPPPTT